MNRGACKFGVGSTTQITGLYDRTDVSCLCPWSTNYLLADMEIILEHTGHAGASLLDSGFVKD